MSLSRVYDMVIIGSGPAGQKAAIQAAKGGLATAIVEREPGVGGACVHHGTIPSKTLRQTAYDFLSIKRTALPELELPSEVQVSALMTRLRSVVDAHAGYLGRQLERNGVDIYHGRASFLTDQLLSVQSTDGSRRKLRSRFFIIATGSRPRRPPGIPIDHEHILDSDSFLSMVYLPRSLTVLGGGVIASEYASIMASLGVRVTMIDRADRPLRFMEQELTTRFEESFRAQGGTFIGGRSAVEVSWDGFAETVARLDSGQEVRSQKMLVALGRVANLGALNIELAGLCATDRGFLQVDEFCRTSVEHIYAVGDVVGPPALAATAMEQGRRAACHAIGISPGNPWETIPVGIYSIPEMSCVGLSEEDAREKHGAVWVGKAHFSEIARGQICGSVEGMLKMVADPRGRLVGVHIVGYGATELIHLGQMALINDDSVETFVENVFNFPTLAEAYRVAALEIVNQRQHAGLDLPQDQRPAGTAGAGSL